MPNRLLKEGIVDSSAIQALSAEAEVCFYRLLVVSDDYGRMDARTAIIRARCFPLKEQPSLGSKIEAWILELEGAGLLVRYMVDERPYIQINKWEQRVRSKSKYPDPAADGAQLTADCGQASAKCGVGMGKGMGKGASNRNDVSFDAASGAWTVPEAMRTQWEQAYPAVLLDREMASAASWLMANPKNQKSNYARFLANWLQRAQDKAPRTGGDSRSSGGQADAFAGAI